MGYYLGYVSDASSKPMPWIGMYIALASLFCNLAIFADLFHGFHHKKLWFPCKYFTLNAASVTVIAVAMKLPVDLTSEMPSDLDQVVKIGSMAFMCTMMANLMPSLATMDNMQLLTNTVGLGVLVITFIVNVCIQINTGVVGAVNVNTLPLFDSVSFEGLNGYQITASIYVAMLLILLIILTSSALTILTSKQILESKYQTTHETALQQSGRLTVEKLKQHVTNHWIMEGTGSPPFFIACSATTSASGVICAFSATILLFVGTIKNGEYGVFDFKSYGSDYKWSTPVILVTQYFGIVLATIAPLCRCFTALSFSLSIKWIGNNIKVFKVESYWTQKLYDWKRSSMPFSFGNRKSEIVIHFIKILILNFCIGFQMIVVVACKIIALIPIFFLICVSFCIRCWKQIKAMFGAQVIVLEGNSLQQENNQDRRRYVLQLQDDMEVTDRTLDIIIESVNRVILKAEKQQPNQLIKLLQNSKDFEGVRRYARLLVQTLPAEEYHDSWSLPLVTLTTIAISLINLQKDEADVLLGSVSEGLAYVTHVQESVNTNHEYVMSQMAARFLWIEVKFRQKWLGNNLKNTICQPNTTRKILEWFRDTAKNIITEVVGMEIEVSNENLVSRSVCAYSMYCITESLLRSHQDEINKVTKQDLFKDLSIMITDMLASCLTNLPQAIVMKCHTDVIEKREACVREAAQLLGKTTQIINNLQDHEIPSLNQDELAFFDKWCAYFNQSIP